MLRQEANVVLTLTVSDVIGYKSGLHCFYMCLFLIHDFKVKTFNRDTVLVNLALCYLPGASLLSSMNSDLRPESLGLLNDITSCCLFDQRFLHLTSHVNSVTTVVLCHRTEACLEELKVKTSPEKMELR